MARLLLVWERGSGDGHAVVLAQVARLMLERGHEVHLAWQDLAPVRRLLADAFGSPRLQLWQAPLAAARRDDLSDPASYPELLLLAGFGDVEGLHARVLAWRRLLAAIGPDLLLADHAPTALLAARAGTLPLAHIGSSFMLPPLTRPFAPFVDWRPVEPARLAAAEQLALDHANQVLVATGRPPLERLAQLLQVQASFRLGFAELDHYPLPRDAAEGAALGWPAAPEHGDEPVWPRADGPRLIGYLPRTHSALDAVLGSLRDGPAVSLLCIPGASDAELAATRSARLQLVNRPVRMSRALAEAALLLGHGGAGSTHLALQAGRPVLLLPMQAEQLLLARRVAAAGAGIFMWPQEVRSGLAPALAALLNGPGFAVAAQRLAERNRDPADAPPLLMRIVLDCEALMARQPA